jgi:hypothetical protein
MGSLPFNLRLFLDFAWHVPEFFAMSVAIMVLIRLTLLQGGAVKGWLAAEGRVHYGRVAREPDGKYEVDLTYSYYAGEYRSGSYIRRFRNEEEAYAFIREMKDKQITVRYSPRPPDDSVILDRDVESAALLSPLRG